MLQLPSGSSRVPAECHLGYLHLHQLTLLLLLPSASPNPHPHSCFLRVSIPPNPPGLHSANLKLPRRKPSRLAGQKVAEATGLDWPELRLALLRDTLGSEKLDDLPRSHSSRGIEIGGQAARGFLLEVETEDWRASCYRRSHDSGHSGEQHPHEGGGWG